MCHNVESPPTRPYCRDKVLSQSVAKEWKGLMGVPSRQPGDAEFQALLRSASALVFVGMGRFLSYMSPQVSRCHPGEFTHCSA